MLSRRHFLTASGAAVATGTAAQTLAATGADQDKTTPAQDIDRSTAIYVPGYYAGSAWANGKRVVEHPVLARGLKPNDEHARLLSRIGLDGSIRQAVLPVHAHDVAVSPDRSVGILCGFNSGGHVAFDPDTLDVAALGAPFKKGWNGGGHAQFLPDGQGVLLSERAPFKSLRHTIESHHGRITIREPSTMRILESYSTHGIDPHDIRLVEDGRYLVIANYGSVIEKTSGKKAVPRRVVEASITTIEVASGRLVDKQLTGAEDTELRHLAAAGRDSVFAIQALLGDEESLARQTEFDDILYEADITTSRDSPYLSAATLRFSGNGAPPAEMGNEAATKLMRHGLSIKYDAKHHQVIASYPTTHRVMVFDAAEGALLHIIDTSAMGLRYPCGVTLLPDDTHYAVTGFWENLFVFERGTHRLVRDLCLYPMFFGHSHITAA
ncbi:DUF1513 domain-containing protein [Hoeflea sp.]|uniref:DUF1513 domain-containing protein n=1 Tax=Hoeflea sp. TaxID=1940281 RepID=UPI003BAFCEDE